VQYWLLIRTVTIDIVVTDFKKYIPVLHKLQTDIGKEMQGFVRKKRRVFSGAGWLGNMVVLLERETHYCPLC